MPTNHHMQARRGASTSPYQQYQAYLRMQRRAAAMRRAAQRSVQRMNRFRSYAPRRAPIRGLEGTYYSVPSLGFWWWFYNTPKNQHVLQYGFADGRQQWSEVRYLTNDAGHSWWMDANEAQFTGAPYDTVQLFRNEGSGWRRVA